ncbi:S41 family peptidase [Candidatus Woesebacteria bacterium]|nr:S41 family peptidase [Candidatus Woesebacteria bacterium]
MKISLEVIRSFVVALLILVLGALMEHRYSVLSRFPLSLLTRQSAVSSNSNGSTLDRLINTDQLTIKSTVDFRSFWQAWQFLENEYNEPEKLDPAKMVDGAIGGMVASLGDAYTMYLPPEDKVRTAQDLAGAFYGVGIELGYVEGTLAVIAPLDGSPAAQAGVEAGDFILRVKDEAKKIDEETQGWSLTKAVDTIRGPKDSPVVLTLLRKSKGPKPFEVVLKRQEIVVKSVVTNMVEHNGKKAVQIKLSRFGERTMSEWDEAVATILKERKNISGIVLDMRNNPGGFFDDSIKIASDFIPSGTVVTQKGRFENKSFPSNGSARLAGIPVVVLVNGGSASASEIVAGALRDRLSAKLVGQKTFGKGTVQDRRELQNGGGIHITIARWMLPGGEWIHEHGIPVSVEVQDNPDTKDDEMLLQAIDTL